MRQHKYLLLLAATVCVLIVEASARRSFLGPFASDLLIAALALGVFLVVFHRRWTRIAAFLAASASIVFSFSRYLPIPPEYSSIQTVAHHLLMAAFLGIAVAVILDNIFAARTISGDEVLGTVCGYLLAAAAWANAYVVIAFLVPEAFSVGTSLKDFPGEHGQTALFNYFSVVTLTTMGYGDITPTRPPATALAMLEAIFGQFYIAIVVAQLVGLRLAHAMAPSDPAPR